MTSSSMKSIIYYLKRSLFYLKRKLKDGDWYLDANEAVYYGFADAVLATRKFPSIGSLK